MSINYIVACWSGLRRVNPQKYIDNRTAYINKHIESLSTLKHSIDQITVVINDDPNEPENHREYVHNIPNKINNSKVEIIRRPNVGYSYGAYSDVFAKYHEQFDYYILMEDDYIFMQDNFDDVMLALIDREEHCGFLSFALRAGTRNWLTRRIKNETPNSVDAVNNVAKYCPDVFKYPMIAVGLVRSKALEDVWNMYGRLPYADGHNHDECKFEGQFAQSTVLQKIGWNLADMIPQYRANAFSPTGEKLEYGPIDKPLMIAASQFLI